MPLTKDSDVVQKVDYGVNENPKCPFCDEDIIIGMHDLYDLYQEGEHSISCPYCEKDIQVETTAIWRFSTYNQPEFE